MDKILRIDVGTPGGPKASVETLGRYAGLGGRALADAVVVNEVPPDCHPLGPRNKLVLAPGLMSGMAGMPGRLSIACKGPLTGGITQAGAAGTAGQALARLGYAALVIEGARRGDDLYQVLLSARGVSITTAGDYRMLPNYDLAEAIAARCGTYVSLVSIGATGEMRMSTASLTVTDAEFRPTRPAGRGGAGAVMGAKGVKCIVIDPAGTNLRRPADAATFRAASRKFTAGLGRTPARTVFPRADATAWSRGDTCGITDMDSLARLDFLGDHYGLDILELSVTVGLAMEAGVAPFADGEGAIGLVHEIGRGTPLGRILGAGSATTARCFGIQRAPADAVRPAGAGPAPAADALLTSRGPRDGELPPRSLSRIEQVQALQVAAAALDATGHGPDLAGAVLARPETLQALVDAVNAMLDLHLTVADMAALGQRVLTMEREFNARAGYARAHDRLPRYFSRTPLPPHHADLAAPEKELDGACTF